MRDKNLAAKKEYWSEIYKAKLHFNNSCIPNKLTITI